MLTFFFLAANPLGHVQEIAIMDLGVPYPQGIPVVGQELFRLQNFVHVYNLPRMIVEKQCVSVSHAVTDCLFLLALRAED